MWQRWCRLLCKNNRQCFQLALLSFRCNFSQNSVLLISVPCFEYTFSSFQDYILHICNWLSMLVMYFRIYFVFNRYRSSYCNLLLLYCLYLINLVMNGTFRYLINSIRITCILCIKYVSCKYRVRNFINKCPIACT